MPVSECECIRTVVKYSLGNERNKRVISEFNQA